MPRTILLVDDDALMRRSLAFHLQQAGYQVQTAASAEDALALVRHAPPDLVVLDIGLPGMDGLEGLREIKAQDNLPVIFLTGRRRELDEVVGLEMGADDYITKPFDVDVVLAHIKAVLRRTDKNTQPESVPQRLIVGDLDIDPRAHTVFCAGHPISLSPREFDLLLLLASQPEKVFSTEDLLAMVWGAPGRFELVIPASPLVIAGRALRRGRQVWEEVLPMSGQGARILLHERLVGDGEGRGELQIQAIVRVQHGSAAEGRHQYRHAKRGLCLPGRRISLRC